MPCASCSTTASALVSGWSSDLSPALSAATLGWPVSSAKLAAGGMVAAPGWDSTAGERGCAAGGSTVTSCCALGLRSGSCIMARSSFQPADRGQLASFAIHPVDRHDQAIYRDRLAHRRRLERRALGGDLDEAARE